MVTIAVVRHAKAGRRKEWNGDDRRRPLSDAGRAQAGGLVPLLSSIAPTRLISSPFLRCIQTLHPLAQATGLDVEEAEELGEGGAPDLFLRLVRAADTGTVLSTHGDMMGILLTWLEHNGVELPHGNGLEKGACWVVRLEDGTPREARLHPAPRA